MKPISFLSSSCATNSLPSREKIFHKHPRPSDFMGSLTVPKLPIINFSIEDLKPGSASWLSTAKQVRSALEEYSCFVAQYEQISEELLNNMFGQAKDLLEVPEENKVKNVSDEPYHGRGRNPLVPLYESLCIDNVTSPQETQKFKNLMWPEGKSNFCETTDSFGQLLADLERTIEQLIFESYGIGKQYESVGSSNSHLLRFIKYKVPEDKDATLRFPIHTDKNFTTIVAQHEIPGLEVKTKEGDWITVESVPSQFVFMADDGLQVWSNDRVKACEHRVKHCGNKTRYSVVLFTFNNGILQVPEELVDESHPLLYNAFDSRAFIRKYFTTPELMKEPCPIKAFAGVKA